MTHPLSCIRARTYSRLGIVSTIVGILVSISLGLVACGTIDDPSLPPGANNTAPVAIFSASPGEGRAPLNVRLDASASFDPDGEIVRYRWDFGNGLSLTGEGFTVEHVFLESDALVRIHTVRLTVTDNQGASHTTSQRITVRSGEVNSE